MRILYPSDPLNPRAVESTYLAEFGAVQTVGYATSFFSMEDFLAGDFHARPAIQSGDTILLRSWMLSVPQYAQIARAVESVSARMLTSVESYEECHHLPRWYQTLKEFTAETIVLPEDADFTNALAPYDWPGYFVKDYVKSLTTAEGSLAALPHDVARIVSLLKQYRGTIEGGICVRKREEYVSDSEQRFFVLAGCPFSPTGDVPALVRECAARIQSPFFSVDIARRADGELRVIELGDGQVSDRKEWGPDTFVAMLVRGTPSLSTPSDISGNGV